jgi:hypothetical protein
VEEKIRENMAGEKGCESMAGEKHRERKDGKAWREKMGEKKKILQAVPTLQRHPTPKPRRHHAETPRATRQPLCR